MKKLKRTMVVFALILILCLAGVAAAPVTNGGEEDKGKVELSMTTAFNVVSGKGGELGDGFAVSPGSVVSVEYNVSNNSTRKGQLEMAVYERIVSSSGSVISDWHTLNVSMAPGSSKKVNGSSITINANYGDSVTYEYRLSYRVDNQWEDAASGSVKASLYNPAFNVTYTTDANPVGVSDFPLYFGGQITLTQGIKVGSVKVSDSVYGLLTEVGDLKQGETGRFQKKLSLPAGNVNSYIIIEYQDLLTGQTVKVEKPDVKASGKIIDAQEEPRLELNITSPVNYIKSSEELDITFTYENKTSYEVIMAFIYMVDENGQVSETPLFDLGGVSVDEIKTQTYRMTVEPDRRYSYAVYSHVADSNTPFKTTAELLITSVEPSLKVERTIDTEKLPFYTEAKVHYTFENISEYELTNVVISDGILGEIHTVAKVGIGESFEVTAEGKFTKTFESEPSVTLVLADGSNTEQSFRLDKQAFEVEIKEEPSIYLEIENIDASKKAQTSFDAVVINDGNAEFASVQLLDERTDEVLDESITMLQLGDKQVISLEDQDYSEDKEIALYIKAKTFDGQEMEFRYEPTKLSQITPAIIIACCAGAAIIIAGVIIVLVRRKKQQQY